MSKQLTDGDTFEHRGRTFTLHVEHDDCMGAPWEEHDGHGPVREAHVRNKTAGEHVLSINNHSGYGYLYNWKLAVEQAKTDGWGMSREDQIAFAWKHWRCPTKGEIAAHAVQKDFDYLRRWCNDQWHWVYVMVECKDELHGEHSESLGGMESDDYDYLSDVGYELADQISDELDELDESVMERMARIADAKEMFG